MALANGKKCNWFYWTQAASGAAGRANVGLCCTCDLVLTAVRQRKQTRPIHWLPCTIFTLHSCVWQLFLKNERWDSRCEICVGRCGFSYGRCSIVISNDVASSCVFADSFGRDVMCPVTSRKKLRSAVDLSIAVPNNYRASAAFGASRK